MNILIIGPQGSGKGVQADLLSKVYSIPAISAGQLMREEAAAGTIIGEKIKSIINSGELIPGHIAIELLDQRISKDDCKKGFIIDGFPRKLDQGMKLTDRVHIDHLIFLEVPDDVSIERIAKRRVCPKCGKVFKDSSTCPCGGTPVQREDDKPEIIKRRLQIYHETITPILDWAKEKGFLRMVNGDQSIEAVHLSILDVLEATGQ
jgi:adenylate kinase